MRSDRRTNGVASTLGASLRWRLLGLAVLTVSLALAPPAQAAPAEQPGQLSAVQQSDVAAVAGTHLAVPGSGERPLGQLPFAPFDFAIMVLGGVILTGAAAGALILFGSRLSSPARVQVRSASDPPLFSAEQGATAHAPA